MQIQTRVASQIFDSSFMKTKRMKESLKIVDPDNHLDDPALLCPPELVSRGTPKPGTCTNKHKVKFHDAVEASDEVMQATDPLRDFEDASEDLEDSGETQDSGSFLMKTKKTTLVPQSWLMT